MFTVMDRLSTKRCSHGFVQLSVLWRPSLRVLEQPHDNDLAPNNRILLLHIAWQKYVRKTNRVAYDAIKRKTKIIFYVHVISLICQ